MPQLILTIVALVVMYLRGGRYSVTDIRDSAGAAELPSGRKWFRPPPRRSHRVRNYVVLVALLAWPFMGAPFSLLGDAVQAALFVVAASSIVLLTGWVGQISLAQAAFVGIGGFGSALVINQFGLAFPLNLVAGAVIAAAAAAGLGVVALRVRGLYLAVATLIFAYMADSYLFVAPWFAGSGGVTTVQVDPIGTPGTYPYFDLAERRTFYFVALAVAATVLFALANLRDSKTGRAFFAIRGSETAAASLGIDVRRYKLLAFALAGGIAGLAGNLQLVSKGTVVSAEFGISVSLLYLAIAVVGGLQSLEGLVASAVLFAGLNELFYRVSALSGYLEVVSAGLLAAVLLLYPGGLAQLPGAVRRLGLADRVARVRARAGEALAAQVTAPASAEGPARVPSAIARRARLAEPVLRPLLPPAREPEPETPPPVAVVAAEREALSADLDRLGDDAGVPAGIVAPGVAVLEARNVRVVFDGLVAVDDASLAVFDREIVGLIGPNGAGKTTLFNAISGLVTPTTGTVHLFGEEVTGADVHVRARRGLGRTFQAIQLFPQLSVYENLLVATHANNESGLFAHVALTRRGLRHEAAAEDVVRRVVAAMGLEAVADRTVAGLPFGVLRQVEIARTVVTGAPVVMLDEPASGLDNAETDRLSDLLYGLRDKLGLSLLLIEHDVRMVTEVSDRMYVLVYGQIVASGTPDEVRDDPVVTAAYLGEPAPTVAEAVPA
jgi:sulfate-transporting ATPase